MNDSIIKIKPTNKKRTTEEYKVLVSNINPNIIVCDEYINSHTKIKHKCLIDGCEWNAIPTNILKGEGCPECGRKKISKALSKSKDDFLNKLKAFHPNTELISEYVRSSDDMTFRCKNCGYEWTTNGYSMIHAKNDCPKCSNYKKKTPEEFKELVEKMGKVYVVGEYKTVKENVLVRCKYCGYEYYGNPSVLLSGGGCRKCSDIRNGENLKLTTEEFLFRNRNSLNENVILLSEYNGVFSPIKCQCNICNNIWLTTPSSLKQGSGCPECAMSHGEIEISKYLKEHSIPFEMQKKFADLLGVYNSNLAFDFYVESKNLLIEYQGEQHYKSVDHFGGIRKFKIQQEHDLRKREYAKEHNILLLEIRFDEDIKKKLSNYI